MGGGIFYAKIVSIILFFLWTEYGKITSLIPFDPNYKLVTSPCQTSHTARALVISRIKLVLGRRANKGVISNAINMTILKASIDL